MNLPNWMHGDLLPAHQGIKGVVDECAAYSLCGSSKELMQGLDLVASTNTKELQNWLVILESEHGLATYKTLSDSSTQLLWR